MSNAKGAGAPAVPFSPALERVPPQALEAEQAILGCLLIDDTPKTAERARQVLIPGDFYREPHRAIFMAALALRERGQGTDVLTVLHELEERGQGDFCGGKDYLLACTSVPRALASFPTYLQQVKATSLKRQLVNAAGEITGAAYNGAAPQQVSRLATRIASLAAALGVPKDDRDRAPYTGAELLAMELPPIVWVVPDLLPEGLAMLMGKPKIRKSFLAIGLVIAVAAGGCVLGETTVEPGEALYLALEDPKRRVQARYRQLLGESPADARQRAFFQTEWERWDCGGAARLAAWLGEHPLCRLVVIDTLAKIRPTRDPKAQLYDEDYAAISEMKRLADAHRIALALIHHDRKGEAADFIDRASGSTGQTGAADTILGLTKGRGENWAVLETTGREIEERKLALEWDDRAGWQSRGDADHYAKSEAERQVMSVFRQAPEQSLSAADVAADLDATEGAIKRRLQRMAQRGVLLADRAGRGFYRLAAGGSERPHFASEFDDD